MNGNHGNNQKVEEVIDIEEYIKGGKPVPQAKKYLIKVDKEKYTVDHPIVSGREVLELANLLPVEQYRLDMKLKGGMTKQVQLEEKVDLRSSGVEKFLTMKLDQTEG